MTWRLTPLETILAGGKIKSTTIGALEQAIVDLFNGFYAVKALAVDGVGDIATSFLTGTIAKIIGGALQVEGATGDKFPALRTVKVPTAFAVLWEMTGTTRKLRFYQSSTGALVVTVNAQWDTPNVGKWTTDDGSACIKYVYDFTSRYGYSHATGNFLDAAWTAFETGSPTGLTAEVGDIKAQAGNLYGRSLLGNGADLTVTAGADGTSATITAGSNNVSGKIGINVANTVTDGTLITLNCSGTPKACQITPGTYLTAGGALYVSALGAGTVTIKGSNPSGTNPATYTIYYELTF